MSRLGIYTVAFLTGIVVGWVVFALIDGWPS